MYKNLYFDRANNEIHLWTDGEHGDKLYEKFKYEKYAYKFDPNGQHRTLNDLPVTKVKRWSREDEEAGLIFEHDVRDSTCVLIDRYQRYEEPSKGHVVLYFDIEVERGQKYSKPAQALNVINAVSFYDTHSKLYRCYLLDREVNLHDRTLDDGTVFKRFTTEQDLLLGFLEAWRKINPSIVTGWNSAFFDVPYLYNRLKNVFDSETANLLSPIGIVDIKHKKSRYTVHLAGCPNMDYQELYRKFTYSEESDYKLETICQKVLQRGKVKYTGSLDDFYKTDIDGFIKYNVTDVELVVALDAKLDLIAIARGTCHKGHCPYEDYLYSSFYLDGSIQTFSRNNGKITNAARKPDGGKAEGAVVFKPRIGIQRWLTSIDLQSLYPSIIMTLGISPETQIGVVKNWGKINLVAHVLKTGTFDPNKFANYGYMPDDTIIEVTTIPINFLTEPQVLRFSKNEFVNYMTDKTISASGMIYTKLKKGIIPTILEQWFDERVLFKKMAKEATNVNEYEYYDRKQLITKILLNSLYGVLLLPSFRYYDKNNGEAVTLTGQSIIKFTDVVATTFYRIFTKDPTLQSPTIYGDSDSSYLDIKPLIPNWEELESTDEHKLVLEIDRVAADLVQFINKCVAWLAKHHLNSDNNRLLFLREKIVKRGLWSSAKKTYALRTIDLKTFEEDIVIKGFASVRSDMPPYFRAVMKQVLTDLLMDKDPKDVVTDLREFKRQYYKQPLMDILCPTSVKELDKYAYQQKGTPINVKSAQNYNKLIEVLGLEMYPNIEEEDKIKYGYLKTNPFGFETIALSGNDDPPEIVQFLEKYLDKDKIFESRLISKLQSLWDDLGFGKLDLDTNDVLF